MTHDPGGKVKLKLPDDVLSFATFSECGQYRYVLHRRWEPTYPARSIMFIMMNPSTATEEVDDPTVRKCRTLADRLGFNHLIIANIMAYRATKELLMVNDPVGPKNAFTLHRLLWGEQLVDPVPPLFQTQARPFLMCVWGTIPKKLSYAERNAIAIIGDHKPHVLRLNKNGMPWHPLYLPNNAEPIPWMLYS